jgi:pimeloyl-ACP methyl ester carboxylesterase
MRRRTLVAGLGLAALAIAGGAVPLHRSFASDMRKARERLDAVPRSTVATRFGTIEWAEAGDGPPVLMLHGTGGGSDQGLLFCARLVAAGWRVIAPSRFGYLGTDFPDDPSAANQADALAEFIDTIGIARLPVLGGSAGAMPAIEFAIRYPKRTAALVAIVPAAFAPGRPPVRPSAVGAAVMRYALKSDVLFWAGITMAEDTMIATLLATDPALVRAAHPDEQARARAILHAILPISLRTRGLLNDGYLAADPAPQALERIQAPTLAISLEDDRFETLAAARHIAAGVAGARLITYPTGGHIWVGRDAELMGEIDAFLRAS